LREIALAVARLILIFPVAMAERRLCGLAETSTIRTRPSEAM